MVTLKLHFTGLCAFVPNHATSANRARVILVNAKHGSVEHHPVLVFFFDSWESGRPIDGDFYDHDKVRMAFCKLDGQDVWVSDPSARKLKIQGQMVKAECSSGDREDFGWLAPMAIINRPEDAPANPKWGSVEDDCLKRTQVPKSVVSRVILTEGALTSYSHAVDDEESVVRWIFRKDPFSGGAGHRQALCEEARLTLDHGDDSVRVYFQAGINEKELADPVYLNIKLIFGSEVFAWIANMPWEDIENRSYTSLRAKVAQRVAQKKGHRDPDYHFSHFYDIVKGPRTLRIPYPDDKRCDDDGNPSVDNPKCPPVQLTAHPDA